jgi:hypothetical protein
MAYVTLVVVRLAPGDVLAFQNLPDVEGAEDAADAVLAALGYARDTDYEPTRHPDVFGSTCANGTVEVSLVRMD